jgi:hypothetical protein
MAGDGPIDACSKNLEAAKWFAVAGALIAPTWPDNLALLALSCPPHPPSKMTPKEQTMANLNFISGVLLCVKLFKQAFQMQCLSWPSQSIG